MHPDEVRIDADTMRSVLRRQAPDWADLEIRALPADVEGTDHTLFRIGEDLLARMPKIGWAADQAASDARWLPLLAPHVPVAVPRPVLVGDPDEGFPYPWSVTRWLPGRNPGPDERQDVALAEQLAAFVSALHSVPTGDGPAKPPNSRGAPLGTLGEPVRETLGRLGAHDDGIDLDGVAQAWQLCLTASDASERVWIHGDLAPGNLLVEDGRLTAVIDWGALGVGDPAPDLTAAWWCFDGDARARYRQVLGHDEAAWLRAAGWALVPAVNGLDYYRTSAPHLAERGRRTILAVLADLGIA